jgi:hypothetical protein
LPVGTDLVSGGVPVDGLEAVRAALLSALAHVDAAELAAGLAARARAAQRPAPLAPLAQVEAAAQLSADDLVVVRPHVAATLEPATTGGGTVLRSRAGQVALAPEDLAAVEALLQAGGARAGDLGVELARTLLLAGVLVPG